MGTDQDRVLKQMLTQAQTDKRFFGYAVGKGNDDFLLLLSKRKVAKKHVEDAWAERMKEEEKHVVIGAIYRGTCTCKADEPDTMEFRLVEPKKAPSALARFLKLSLKEVKISLSVEVADAGDDSVEDDESEGTEDSSEFGGRIVAASSAWSATCERVGQQVHALQSAIRSESLPGAHAAAAAFDRIISPLADDELSRSLMLAFDPDVTNVVPALASIQRIRAFVEEQTLLIADAESNPFGVDVDFRIPLIAGLDHLEEALSSS
jgi:hypothetical protein